MSLESFNIFASIMCKSTIIIILKQKPHSIAFEDGPFFLQVPVFRIQVDQHSPWATCMFMCLVKPIRIWIPTYWSNVLGIRLPVGMILVPEAFFQGASARNMLSRRAHYRDCATVTGLVSPNRTPYQEVTTCSFLPAWQRVCCFVSLTWVATTSQTWSLSIIVARKSFKLVECFAQF